MGESPQRTGSGKLLVLGLYSLLTVVAGVLGAIWFALHPLGFPLGGRTVGLHLVFVGVLLLGVAGLLAVSWRLRGLLAPRSKRD